jgi:histidyl-tRNA synthetase
MFRAERHQRGRYRQFHQVDYEVIGSDDPLVDAEAIALMVEAFDRLGVRGTRVKLGSVGDPDDREAYNAYLRELFGPHAHTLSDDSKDRLERNPMRILDSKNQGDQELIARLRPEPLLHRLGEGARAHFDAVRAALDAWGVPYDVDPGIVRGLDYYRRTAWEVHHENIGAKSALGGGGRYDGLAEQLGGPHTPAVGWAFGVERVLLALQQDGVTLPDAERPLLHVAALDESLVTLAARLASTARASGVTSWSLKPQRPGKAIGDALKRGARYVAFLGSDEVARGYVSIKDLDTGTQMPVPTEVAYDLLARRLNLRSANIADLVLEVLLQDATLLNSARLASTLVSDEEVLRYARAFTNKAFLSGLNFASDMPAAFAAQDHTPGKNVRSLWNFLDPDVR